MKITSERLDQILTQIETEFSHLDTLDKGALVMARKYNDGGKSEIAVQRLISFLTGQTLEGIKYSEFSEEFTLRAMLSVATGRISYLSTDKVVPEVRIRVDLPGLQQVA